MQGTGLELIYNDQAERIEYFRIADLESLRIKSKQAAALSAGKRRPRRPRTGCPDRVPGPNETAVARDPQEVKAPLPDTQPQVAQEPGVFYKCIVSRNVLVDAPDQLIFADEKLTINDVFWSKDSVSSSDEVDAGGADKSGTAAPAEPAGPGRGCRRAERPAVNAGRAERTQRAGRAACIYCSHL